MATPPESLSPRALMALRAGTVDLHRAVDQHPRMRRLMGSSPTLDDYGAVLHCLHQLHARFEPGLRCALASAPTPHVFPSKLPWLEADLRALGHDMPAPPRRGADDPSPPDAGTLAAQGGTLFVLEGATLGGQVLARRIAATLGQRVAGALQYYSAYGPQTRLRWERTCDNIERLLVGPPAIDLAVRQARRVFRAFDRLLDATDRA